MPKFSRLSSLSPTALAFVATRVAQLRSPGFWEILGNRAGITIYQTITPSMPIETRKSIT